jgi:hypothetical protein
MHTQIATNCKCRRVPICHNKDQTLENSLKINPKTWKKRRRLNPLKIDVDFNFQQQNPTPTIYWLEKLNCVKMLGQNHFAEPNQVCFDCSFSSFHLQGSRTKHWWMLSLTRHVFDFFSFNFNLQCHIVKCYWSCSLEFLWFHDMV